MRKRLYSMCLICAVAALAMPAASQTLPTGQRLRDLADRAGIHIGSRVSLKNDQYKTVVLREFNTATYAWYPNWGGQNAENTFDMNGFNSVVNWLTEKGIKPMEHLLFGPSMYEPSWLTGGSYSTAQLETMLRNRIKTLMESNGNATKVNVWNIVNESFQWSGSDGRHWGESDCIWVKLGLENDVSGLTGAEAINSTHPKFIRMAFEYASQFATGKLELRDNTVEFNNRKAQAFYQLAKHLLNSGVKLDGVGFQCHFDIVGGGALDPAALGAQVRKYRALGLEVYFDEVDIGPYNQTWTPALAETQARAYESLMKVALEEGVSQVHMWGLYDTEDSGWRTNDHPLLFDANLNPKPAYYGVQKALVDYLAAHPTQAAPGANPRVSNGKETAGAPRCLADGRMLPVGHGSGRRGGLCRVPKASASAR